MVPVCVLYCGAHTHIHTLTVNKYIKYLTFAQYFESCVNMTSGSQAGSVKYNCDVFTNITVLVPANLSVY